MIRPSSTAHLPLPDALKALASQLIVWHHLAFYGPMSDVVHPHAPALIEWLYDHGRLAVQVFLVVAGFLAARSLAPAMAPLAGPGPLQLIWRRYRRLAPPYLAALALAMLAAALARWLIDHPTIPAAPSLVQIGAHILMLQDVLDVEALSAGVWYVAIDLQLYALLALVLWLLRPVAIRHPAAAPWLTLVVCTGLAAASLFWFNRNPALDEWAPYFFGAFGLGVLAQWIAARPGRRCWARGLLLVLVAGALLLEWRSRILVAGATALLLAWGARRRLPSWLDSHPVGFLSRISYSLFLVHYPVCLAVGALVHRFWPEELLPNGIGMVVAWGLSLAAAIPFYRLLEARRPGTIWAWVSRRSGAALPGRGR